MGDHQFRDTSFEKIEYETWKEEATKALKGASFETLFTHTYENITIKPLYTKEDVGSLSHLQALPGFSPFVRGTEEDGNVLKPWYISQQMNEDDLPTFNKNLKQELEHGQTMISLKITEHHMKGMNAESALSFQTPNDVRRAFSSIPLTTVPIFVDAGTCSLPFLSVLYAYFKEENLDLSLLKGTIGMDPIATLVKTGSMQNSLTTLFDAMAFAVGWTKKKAPNIRTILVSSEPYHNGGGSAVSELAFTIASAVEYVHECMKRGLSIEDVAPKITFSFSVGSNFFMEIAKLRAAKIVWATIVEAFGGIPDNQKINIHAKTSTYTKTFYDPYVNMLRSTVEAFAAALGGVESLHVTPFDEQRQHPTQFSRRIARNTQLILQQEAFLTKVIDPAGGSWYIESLTNELAQKAYTLFQRVEERGGMIAALRAGMVQDEVKRTAHQRRKYVNTRKEKIVGTNVYANLSESKLQKQNQHENSLSKQINQSSETNNLIDFIKMMVKDSSINNNTIDQLVKIYELDQHPLEIEPIQQHRLSQDFESLRQASDRFQSIHGERPKIGIIHIGSLTNYKKTSDFATSFFEAGGFEGVQSEGLHTMAEILQFCSSRKLSTYVLCGKAKEVIDLLQGDRTLFQSLTHVARFYFAGKPALEQQEVLKETGIERFIHQASDCYEELKKLQQEMGVADDGF